MDLNIKEKLFIVTGAGSGLGKGIATALLNEGAKVIVIARTKEKLEDLNNSFPGQVEMITADVTKSDIFTKIQNQISGRYLNGILFNAGGPPAKSFLETEMEDWDTAYANVMRWKVDLTKKILPLFRKQKYGRLVYIESESVKQPIENLVLSNSFRLGVVGFVKTLSREIASEGINLNVMAPGFHDTPAAQRLFVKRSEVENISLEEAKEKYKQNIKVGRMGDTREFGMLGAWLLSPHSGYITGQTISVDGGAVRGIMG
ncbi:MAG: SDR family oxidoreductase [Bacteroidales bacterium]|nr:SDR family oxidoreductase [Bacteroidales bacterium]MCF8403866.1 SDR family oxidoreductase [Bacteroidales bacterium]